MILFKSCPRCTTGDLGLTEDIYGNYMQCFHCGHIIYPKQEMTSSKIKTPSAAKERVAA